MDADDALADPDLPIGAAQLTDGARECAALLGRLMSDLVPRLRDLARAARK